MLTKVLSLCHTTNTHKKTHDAYYFKQNLNDKKKTQNPKTKSHIKRGKTKNVKPQQMFFLKENRIMKEKINVNRL